MQNLKLIGKKIKEIRKRKKISQETLAEMVSMNQRSILRLENSQTIPTLESLEKIAKALDVEVSDFLNNEHLEDRAYLLGKINEIAQNLDDKELRAFYKIIKNFYN